MSRPVQVIVGLAVVATAFFWALPRFAAYDQVWAQLKALEGALIPALLIVGAVNLIAPSMSQKAALPNLGLGHAVATDWATTTVTNLIPGGSALAIGLTWSMYRSFKLATEAIARSIVVTGIWDAFIKLGTPLIAIAWLATQRPVGAALIQAAVVGGLLFVVAGGLLGVVLSGPTTAAALGRRLDGIPVLNDGWPARLESLRVDTVSLLAGRWRSLTVWTVAGHLNLYLLLVVCLRATGIERSVLGWAPVLAAFAFGRLVTAIPITPGGLGVMELGLVSALGVVGDAPQPAVVAAVLLFRFLTFALPIPLGIVSWLWWTATREQLRPGASSEQLRPGESQHGLE